MAVESYTKLDSDACPLWVEVFDKESSNYIVVCLACYEKMESHLDRIFEEPDEIVFEKGWDATLVGGEVTELIPVCDCCKEKLPRDKGGADSPDSLTSP